MHITLIRPPIFSSVSSFSAPVTPPLALAYLSASLESDLCENIGPKELALYRILGMSIFYTLSYLLFPRRIIRSIKNIFFSRKTDTVFEQRMAEYFKTKKAYS